MNDFNKIINFINKSPKAELHLHIEGSLEPELMFKLSKRNKIEIPFKSVEEIKAAYDFTNLDSLSLKLNEIASKSVQFEKLMANFCTLLSHTCNLNQKFLRSSFKSI